MATATKDKDKAEKVTLKPGIQTVRPSKLLGSASRRIQGIQSDIRDVRLKSGEGMKDRIASVGAALVGDGIVLERAVDSASTITLTVHDPHDELLNSELLTGHYHLTLDKMEFTFVGISSQGGNVLNLIHEATPVHRLRQHTGAVKVYRGAWTRAEFLAALVQEAKAPKIPMWVPELHEKQPIQEAAAAREADTESGPTRGPGLDRGGGLDGQGLKVKGIPANEEQLRNGETVLRVGASLNAPAGAMVAAIMAGTQENNMLNSGDGYFQMLPSTQALYGIDASDLAAAAHQAYTDGFWHAGLIESINAGKSPGEACQEMEGSAYPSLYAQWESQGREWVEAFGGGTIDLTQAEGAGGRTVTTTERYSFERKPNEDTWACGVRLAEEVNWRWYEAAGVIYYIDEFELLTSKTRMRVHRDAPGVREITFDWDTGRKVTEVQVTADMKAWAAPPGTVAMVSGKGPANGRYIVASINTRLGSPEGTITLRKATEPLPEPAPETNTRTVGGTSGSLGLSSTGGDDAVSVMIAEADRIDAMHMTYVYGGGHVTPAPANGPFDCSSFVSRLLQKAGYDIPTSVSGSLATMFESGPGRECTIYAHSGHVLIQLRGRFCGTSSSNPGGGPGWISDPGSGYLSAFAQRHPKGL